jgi:hypothetical protein
VSAGIAKRLGAGCLILGSFAPGTGLAQESNVPVQIVSWTVQPQDIAAPDRATLTLHGSVVHGWHVYSLKQAPEGPTPLVVSVVTNDVATANGAPTGSAPVKFHDPAFNLETQFYSGDFTLTVPVRFRPRAGSAQAVPVDVRFQTCNGRICEPPKTVHLFVPVNLPAGK